MLDVARFIMFNDPLSKKKVLITIQATPQIVVSKGDCYGEIDVGPSRGRQQEFRPQCITVVWRHSKGPPKRRAVDHQLCLSNASGAVLNAATQIYSYSIGIIFFAVANPP
jgi:hypothetical protein